MARKSIVTKTGDSGETGLLYGGRVSKADPRTEAYGCVDEAISALGAARALIGDRGRHATILRVQSELFTVGAELATDDSEYQNLQKHFMTVTADFTSRVEAEVDDLERRGALPQVLPPPRGGRGRRGRAGAEREVESKCPFHPSWAAQTSGALLRPIPLHPSSSRGWAMTHRFRGT